VSRRRALWFAAAFLSAPAAAVFYLLAEACSAAERVRHELASSDEHVLARLPPTTSIGISAIRSAAVPLRDLLRQADEALYRAKGDGRNRIVTYD
jgi:diguanylate cyclase (GGDEF)-like protein